MVSCEVWMLWFESSNELSILYISVNHLEACSWDLREGRLVAGFSETGVIGTSVSTLSLDRGDVNYSVGSR